MGRPSKYPDQFRKDAIELVKTSRVVRSPRWPDRSGSPRARCGTGSERPVTRHERGADPDALSESERDELRRLRKENIELQTDKEILRRAAAYFARETMR